MIFGIRKVDSRRYRGHYLRDPMFSRFDTTQTHTHTHRHRTTAYTAVSIAVKKLHNLCNFCNRKDDSGCITQQKQQNQRNDIFLPLSFLLLSLLLLPLWLFSLIIHNALAFTPSLIITYLFHKSYTLFSFLMTDSTVFWLLPVLLICFVFALFLVSCHYLHSLWY